MSRMFRTIDNSELEDFATKCKAYELDPAEFQLEEHDYVETPPNSPIFTQNAKITISRNNVQKTYNTGNATNWVYDFAKDLKKGVFK